MANIIMTLNCNNQCSFCFAREIPAELPLAVQNMDQPTFERVLDFLKRSNIPEVRLLGGEPSIHADFIRAVDLSLAEGFRVVIFTNGLLSDENLDYLESIQGNRLSVLVNCNLLQERILAGEPRQFEVFRKLGKKVIPGFTIHSPRSDIDFLLDLVETYGLKPSIRLGLAHPCSVQNNKSLSPRSYPQVGAQTAAFVEQARQAGVKVDFDCGFVPCMFPSGFLESLGEESNLIGTCCGPVPDILPDGTMISCYPLAHTGHCSLGDHLTAAEVREVLGNTLQPYRDLGIFKECRDCSWRRAGSCSGGCKSAALLRMRIQPFSFTVSNDSVFDSSLRKLTARVPSPGTETRLAPEDKIKRWVIPYIDQPISFWKDLKNDFGRETREVYFPLPGGPGSGRPPQPDVYLEDFIRSSHLPCSVLINPILLKQPLDSAVKQVINQLKELMNKVDLRGATITNLTMACRIKEAIPEISLTASTLMDIASPQQLLPLRGVFDAVVPASRIVRDLPALAALRQTFSGNLRLIVNESCLPGCPLRIQHFYEMSYADSHPLSLCQEMLERFPWIRLTGAWVLPQHLYLYAGLYDELKLSGRVTLSDPNIYRQVLAAYIDGSPLTPDRIGGGPASVLESIKIDAEFYQYTLYCNKDCQNCMQCRDYYREALDTANGGN
ncbi:MAG: radical SAM/SPASM domain-containing protein [Deltaproteobacteria bacterium]